MSVVWRKEYKVKTPDHRNFKVFVSESDNGAIYSSCLWYEGDRALRAPGEKSEGLRFDLKTFQESSEDEAFEKVMVWVVEKFGPDIEVTVADYPVGRLDTKSVPLLVPSGGASGRGWLRSVGQPTWLPGVRP